MSKRIVLFGSYISEDVESDIFNNYLKSAKTFSISNIVYERKLLKGLAKTNTVFLSCPTIGKYPRTLKKKKTEFKNEDGVIYCNYSLRHFLLFNKTLSIKKAVKNNISTFNKGDEVTILVMEMHLPFQYGALFLKNKLEKRGIKVRICSFCPDISANVIDTTKRHSSLYKFFKKIYSNISEKLFKRSDGFVFFTKFMADYFSTNREKYIVIPAIQDIADSSVFFGYKNKYSMLFSGKLQEKNGLRVILDYFDSPLVDKKFKLHICGSGELEEEIKAKAKHNSNIIFHGFLKPREVQTLQSQCLITFSLRDPYWIGSNYSFPSKFFESLSLGNNVITRKLETYDYEIDDFVFYLNDYSIVGLNAVIREALQLSNEKKEKQFNYLKQFEPANVCKKILDFVSKI